MKRYSLLFKLAIALSVKNGLTGFYFIPLKIKGSTWDLRYTANRKTGIAELVFTHSEKPRLQRHLVLDSAGTFMPKAVGSMTRKRTTCSAQFPSDAAFLQEAEKGLIALAACSPENKACRKLSRQGLIEGMALCA